MKVAILYNPRPDVVSGALDDAAEEYDEPETIVAITKALAGMGVEPARSEEHTSELQSLAYLVCRLLLEKKNRPTPSSAVASTTPPSLTRSTSPRRSAPPPAGHTFSPSACSFPTSTDCRPSSWP